ncbi:MAG: glycosyltransferase family 4 protein [Saprospiraceae bacterium]|nr:glycosyltransferase family 4 protein [Saprospiraceae bacterium]
MNIALVANSTWNIYNFRLNVIDKLLAEGHNVFVIAPIDEYLEYKEKYPKVKHYSLKTLDRDSTNPLKDLLLVIELARKYKRIRPDLIIHYTNKPNIFGGIAAKYVGIPSIAMVTGLGYAFIHNGLIKLITTFLYRLTGRWHKKFIFENIEDRELFEDLKIIKPTHGVSIKGCGVNTTYFAPYPNGVVKPGDEVIFTFIGRLLYDKGIKEFVLAAQDIKEKYPKVSFWIVGELDLENPATVDKEDLIGWTENDIVYYHGFQRDVRPFIAKSDCIVLPSYREAIPRTITEGMSMGKPVITTDTAGCREAVDIGENGFLAEVKSTESLKETFEQFIKLSSDQRHKMGEAGRQKALKEFDDRKIANDIYSEIEKILH